MGLRAIQNLSPQGIVKKFRQFYSRNRWTYKIRFFSFFKFYVFVINKITVTAFLNIGILIPFRMQPIRIRYIEPFSRNYNLKKKVKKILTSNISEIYGSILWRKKLSRLVYKIYPYKKFKSD